MLNLEISVIYINGCTLTKRKSDAVKYELNVHATSP